MLRRTAFKSDWQPPPRARDLPPPPAPAVRPLVVGTYSGGPGAAAPKPEAQRNRRLLDLARGMPCLLLVPAICNHRLDTTVAAHSNLAEHGKAMGRKADDHYSVHSCFACHTWLDAGRAPAAHKEAVFMAAHARQVLVWRLIATDAARPEGDRRAARWALDLLNATPVGAIE